MQTHRLLSSLFALAMGGGVGVSAHAATFVVNSTSDGADDQVGDGVCRTTLGTCTLRAALQEANSVVGPHVINFAIAGQGVKTIRPNSDLPIIAQAITVDGWSQGDARILGRPLIEISGENTQAYNGVQLAVAGSVLQGVIVNGFRGHGVFVNYGTLRSSWVGTDSTGNASKPNGDSAVVVGHAATIGGNGSANPCSGDCNVISGNARDAIEVVGTGSVISGNAIGLAADGTTVLGNGRVGIRVTSPIAFAINALTIGTPGAGNVIVGHFGAGVVLSDNIANAPSRIAVRYNAIYDNGSPAIVYGTTVPPNDNNDADIGPNTLLNRPVLESVSFKSETCTVEVRGRVGRNMSIDFYAANDAESGDPIAFLATGKQGVNDAWNAAAGYSIPEIGSDSAAWGFALEFPLAAKASAITATAVDANNNTSPFAVPLSISSLMTSDSDGDGIADVVECAIGSDPESVDSDGDGIPDAEEFGPGVTPRDTDGDGIIDILDEDDDGDGLSTLLERTLVGAGPVDLDGDGLPFWLDTDSDGDGIPDGVEQSGAVADVDGDGQPNFNDVDSDGDGLCDTPLVRSSLCVSGEDLNANGVVEAFETSPYHADTDADGFCDGPGCEQPVDNCPLVSNPEQLDSNDDGIGDACDCSGGICAPGFIECFIDRDGDGFTGTRVVLPGSDCSSLSTTNLRVSSSSDGDCDDSNAGVFPGAFEVCDGVDNSCDGLIDGADTTLWQADPGMTGALMTRFYVDADEDGCGMAGTLRYVCDLTEAQISDNSLDQNDGDGICCGNGIIEEGEACDGSAPNTVYCPEGYGGYPLCENHVWNTSGNGSCTYAAIPSGCYATKICWADEDGDGFTGTRRDIPADQSCATFKSGPADTPWTEVSDGDCLDVATINCSVVSYPGAPELCDGCDNDCDSTTPDGVNETWFGDTCTPDREVEECEVFGLVCGSGLEPVCGLTPDSSFPITLYLDGDADGCGFGDEQLTICAKDDVPEGYSHNNYDIDDTDGVCCGNGVIDDGEMCDGIGVECATINPLLTGWTNCTGACTYNIEMCTGSTCGNGSLESELGETCDPSVAGSLENCRENCTFCGDNVLQFDQGETCERSDPWCRLTSCTYCGDGFVQLEDGEECEPRGSQTNTCEYGDLDCRKCNASCEFIPGEPIFCGDGVVQAAFGEECDGGSECTSECLWDSNSDGGCNCSSTSAGTTPWIACLVSMILLALSRRRKFQEKRSAV